MVQDKLHRKHREKGSPTCFLNVDNNSMEVTFPQDYGPDKSFTYYITDQAIEQARSERKIDPIVDEVARSISRSWQTRKSASGSSYISQFENAKGYLWRCLTEQQLHEFRKMQRGDKYQTSLMDFFSPAQVAKRQEDMKIVKDRIPKSLIDFLQGKNFWYVLYHQATKAKAKAIVEWYATYMR